MPDGSASNQSRQTETHPRAASLLAWYDRHARVLPWRVAPVDRRNGVRPDPYAVWLSEIMLQQTTVQTVAGYFEKFLTRWPRLQDLAQADEHNVLAAWAGLGYYSRARNLKACADTIAADYDGQFPTNAAELQALPGIGPYTAAAIAAIAFDEPVAAVDGNVERVLTRFHAIDTPLPGAKTEVTQKAGKLVPTKRPGDFAQALMDLGATICTPKRPACALCPWMADCAGRQSGQQLTFPVKAPKKVRPHRLGGAFVVVRADGAILLRRRANKGLLASMTEVPGTVWAERITEFEPAISGLADLQWSRVAGKIRHVFTHFSLDLTVWKARTGSDMPAPPGHWWSTPKSLPDEALPTVMRKVIAAAMED